MLGGMPIASSDARSIQRRAFSATAPTDGQVAAWVAATSLWTPQTLGAQPGGVGVLDVKNTPTGNVGGGEDTLYSFVVPGGTLAADKDLLDLCLWGTLSTGVATRTLRLKFGATTFFSVGFTFATFGGAYWRCYAKIVRTGAAAQITIADWFGDQAGTPFVQAAAPAETLSGNVTLAVTGESTLALDNDITLNGLVLQRSRNP